MNYHGYLINLGGSVGESTIDRFFDPWMGPLSTRFAATFVFVAGMGITLMTNRGAPQWRSPATRCRSLDADSPWVPAVRVRLLLRVAVERHDPVLLRRVLHRRRAAVLVTHTLVDPHRVACGDQRGGAAVVGLRDRPRHPMAVRWVVRGHPIPFAAPLAVRHVRQRHAPPAPLARVPVRRHGDRPLPALDRFGSADCSLRSAC